jgi:hypothetical protein
MNTYLSAKRDWGKLSETYFRIADAPVVIRCWHPGVKPICSIKSHIDTAYIHKFKS